MSEIIRKFGQAWKPAGYLPAPQQARFISTAEEAAKRLPANIKAQSVMNQLQKLGAKPLELEYAGLGKFLGGKDRVSSQDVLAHLQQQGPLGQLKRVDQGDAPHDTLNPDAGQLDLNVDNPADDVRSPGNGGNFYQSNVRAPFGSDPRGAFPDTGYASYTVPGQRGDFTGYRESLIEDPKTREFEGVVGGMLDAAGTRNQVVNAHNSDYWLRYNNLPDRIAIQNVQSDIGQKASASKLPSREQLLAEIERADARLSDFNARHPHLAYGLNPHVDDPLFEEILEEGPAYYGYNDDQISEYRNLLGERNPLVERFNNADLNGLWDKPGSPIARDNNWKNLMLRHALLESVSQGGKPITLPTGQQMVDVEGFGMGGRGSSDDPATKAARFNEDLANRLMKAMKEIHPKGGAISSSRAPAGEQFTLPLVTSIERHPNGSTLFSSQSRRLPGQPRDLMSEVRRTIETGNPYDDEPLDDLMPRFRQNRQVPDDVFWHPEGARPGLDEGVFQELEEISREHVLPEVREMAINAMNQWQLAAERGKPLDGFFGPGGEYINRTDDAAPGWTITPHPETVRAALQKGVPIMSLAPLLLAPRDERK